MGSEIKPDKSLPGIDGLGFTVRGVNGLLREGLVRVLLFGFRVLMLDSVQLRMTGEVREKHGGE